MILVIGNKSFSSWSLRPWLLMKQFGIAFEERVIPLNQANTTSQILQWSASAKVPVLVDGNIRVWESLAIMEYIAEKFPSHAMWPREPARRAWARSVSNEMHGGFVTMRTLMSHDLRKVIPGFDSSGAQTDIQRVKAIWAEGQALWGGPFLAGSEFTIADAMYAPVANRFVTYDVELTDYAKKILELPAMKEWKAAGLAEKF